MSVLNTVKGFFEESKRQVNASESKGAYWCHDCSERILDLDVDANEPPTCPNCGDDMEFHRSRDSKGCAC